MLWSRGRLPTAENAAEAEVNAMLRAVKQLSALNHKDIIFLMDAKQVLDLFREILQAKPPVKTIHLLTLYFFKLCI